ncbi:hypothetical protein [Halobacillus amylolyticus]|uniref:Uncharacterized protein n=1 Tax=Halobacillus amylolyticus TaxID=2932259 RepID=A0ABY4HD44_9BACI|nr:hypothetical protein [Halobacillus amylolyticus]UOR12821.1 hypothetical protein MUO15_04715 [Halobacillus amylolyticus]
MQKIYLSIIALLTLTLFVTFNYTNNEKNTQESQNVEKSLGSTEVFKPPETYGITINISEFRDYFSSVEAKKNIFEGQQGVATKTENIPPENHKEVALGLLLEAKKSISAAGKLGIPKLENQKDFFQPTDKQLRKLIKLRNNKLATNIVQRIVILRDANDLIDNEVINEQIKSVTERLARIKIYEKDTLYKFSLAYKEYKECIILIHKMTQELG